ncbi:MAG: calcium-translocating P-type ATPase, PMCA-type [Synergistaceae bacterium]|jgi:Ca2+-transporting ATPase|nr:calcium-translocating P-type ATPase, PMCA-type [Synergistaceae bacterium]
MTERNWYAESTEAVTAAFDVDPGTGLSGISAEERLKKYGPNKLDEKPPRTFLERFIDQLKDMMIIILFIAAGISLALSAYHASKGQEAEWIEPIVIVLIILVNGVLGVIQESKAEAALEALKKMSMPQVKVRRDGAAKVIQSAEVVPGDVILLEAGDVIPADCRLVASASLKSNESALTGESMPVEKSAIDEVPESALLAERTNMLYSGNSITYGRGTAVAVATGMDTEMGKIASMIASSKEGDTPLQEKLAQLGKYIGVIALLICAVIFLVGIMSGLHIIEMFMTAVSLAVAAIPEGLPAIVTIVLAIGVRRMVIKNAIIRRLPAVETLGSTTVICSDKTGTLTQNRMTLVKVFSDGAIRPLGWDGNAGNETARLLKLGALCTDGTVEIEDGVEKHIGDPTETSIVAAALRAGMTKEALLSECPRVGEIPFDSDRKLMTTVNMIDGKYTVIVKGAPDILYAKCISGDIDSAAAAGDEMSQDALRVLAVGCKEIAALPEKYGPDDLETGLDLVGLVGMIDPPRAEVKDSIEECVGAGIKTVMITGDHVVTASAIAKQLGILHDEGESLTGRQLAAMTDEQLDESVERYRVYARVSPSDKIRIVQAWQKKDQIVAMTGDGVNDAPALKASDIGCAMGITGTDVAKGASDMILTDDNFATIVSAIREGRGIYDNIRKAVRFLLSCNLGEIITVFAAMLLWQKSPLLPIQILWINLVTDSFPALALGMEMIEPGIMNRQPRKKDESLFSGGIGTATVIEGTLIGLLTLIAYYIGTRGSFLPNIGIELGETMCFSVLALSQLVHAMNVRSSHSLFKVGFLSNPYMVKALIASTLCVLAVLYVPFLSKAFKLSNMNAAEWGIVIALSLLPLAVCEVRKALFSSGKRRAEG